MRSGPPPDLDDIAALAESAFAAVPAILRERVCGVAILVEDEADSATLAELGLEDPWELTGVYRGVAMPLKSLGDIPHEPDTIVLYRVPILLEWIDTGEDLFRLVRNVLLHEIAHHFGFSDEDISRLESAPDAP